MGHLTKGDILRDSYGEWLLIEMVLGSCLFVLLDSPKLKFRKCFLSDITNQIDSGDLEFVDRVCHHDTTFIVVNTEAEKRVEQRNLKIVEALLNYDTNLMWLANTKKRSGFIKNQADEHDVICDTIRNFLRKFLQNNLSMKGLESKFKNCGAPGKERLYVNGLKPGNKGKSFVPKNEELKIALDWALNRYLKLGTERTKRAIYDDMISEFFSVEYRVLGSLKKEPLSIANKPTYKQLLYYFDTHTTTKELHIAAHDERDFMNNMRALESDTIATLDIMSIGAQYEIDAMDTDYELVDRFDDTRRIGTACLYFIIDTYSKIICGYAVGLDTNSWAGCQMALLNMVEDKVEYCKKYGIDIKQEEWPVSFVIPSAILMDNGSDFISNDCKNFGARNAIRLSYTPSRMPSMKGNIEKKFDQFNKELAGIVPGKRKKIRYKDSKPILTIEDMDLIALHFIIHYNQIPINNYKADRSVFEAGIETSPVNIWNLKVGQENGLRKIDNMLQYRFDLLSEANATITREGIYFKGIYYTCENQQWLRQKMQEARDGRIPIKIRYDKRNMNEIYFVINNKITHGWINKKKADNGKYFECHFYELSTINKRKKDIQERGEETAQKHRINMHSAIEEISINAKRHSSGKTSNKNIKKNRKAENERLHFEKNVMSNESLGQFINEQEFALEEKGRVPTRLLLDSMDKSQLSTFEIMKLNEQIKYEEEEGIYVAE